jgi:hypothetical protein
MPAAVARQAAAAIERETAAASAPNEAPLASSAPPAAQATADSPAVTGDEVLLELKGSALTSDLDRIGDRLEITATEVRQRGRGNKERGRIAMHEVRTVAAEKTVKGHWLRVTAADGRELLQQGLEAGPAEHALEVILTHAPDAVDAAASVAAAAAAPSAADAGGAADIPEQIRKLAELHQQGILTDQEFQSKKQELLDRM